MHQKLLLCLRKLLAYFHMVLVDLLVVLKKKMGGRHSKAESTAKACPPRPPPRRPRQWQPPPPPPPPCMYPCPCHYYAHSPLPPNSYWGPKPASQHPVSIPASMPSLETASLPSSKSASAPASAKLGISETSQNIQLEDMKIKIHRKRIKTASRSILHLRCAIKMVHPDGGKKGQARVK